MTVTNVERQWRYESGEIEGLNRRFGLVWRVETDSESDGAVTVLDAPGIPRYGDGHPENAHITCRSRRIRERIGARVWDVECIFELGGGGNRYRVVKHPLDRPVEAVTGSTYFSQTVEPIDTDAEGKPICTSAGEGFDPPLQREFSYRVYRFAKNYESFNDAAADALIDTTNAASWFGWPAGTCRMKAIGRQACGEDVDGQEVEYQHVEYEVHARYAGWKRRVVDAGHRDKNYKEAVDPISGQPSTRPRLLDGQGNWSPGPEPQTHWLEFVDLPAANWAGVPEPP